MNTMSIVDTAQAHVSRRLGEIRAAALLGCLSLLLALSLTACGSQEEAADADDPAINPATAPIGAEEQPPSEPDTPAVEDEAANEADTSTADEANGEANGEAWIDQPLEGDTVSTRSGSITLNADQHRLQVVRGDERRTYATSPVGAALSEDEQRALLSALDPNLRYPADRVRQVSGTHVSELGRGGNRLVRVAYTTADSVDAAVQHYRRSLADEAGPVEVVVTPLGEQQLATVVSGMGEQRVRVLITPTDAGSQVEVTQIRVAGTATDEFDTGQGLLQQRPAARATTEPARADEPAAEGAAADDPDEADEAAN